MALRDYEIPKSEIVLTKATDSKKAVTMDVRGLSVSDLSVILSMYGPQAALLFQRFQTGESITNKELRTIIAPLIQEFPGLVAAAIALATDDFNDKAVATAGKLRPATQVEALEAIFSLTFDSEAELKKLVESIVRMLGGTTSLLQQMRLPPSEAGSFANAA